MQKRVIDEVDSVFGELDFAIRLSTFQSSGCSDRPCTIDDLRSLPYLEQCVKESHRLFSPVPMLFRKVEQDFKCGE